VLLDDIKLFENTPMMYISLRTHLAPVTLLETELEKRSRVAWWLEEH